MIKWNKENPDYYKNWRKANPNYFKEWHKAHPNYNKELKEKAKVSGTDKTGESK